MKTQGHFWIIFTHDTERGWRPYATARGGLDIHGYRSKREAGSDLFRLRAYLGVRRVRLCKFKPEYFILGFSKPERKKK